MVIYSLDYPVLTSRFFRATLLIAINVEKVQLQRETEPRIGMATRGSAYMECLDCYLDQCCFSGMYTVTGLPQNGQIYKHGILP